MKGTGRRKKDEKGKEVRGQIKDEIDVEDIPTDFRRFYAVAYFFESLQSRCRTISPLSHRPTV